MTKGWKNESSRHALARKGIKTGTKKKKRIVWVVQSTKIKNPQPVIYASHKKNAKSALTGVVIGQRKMGSKGDIYSRWEIKKMSLTDAKKRNPLIEKWER